MAFKRLRDNTIIKVYKFGAVTYGKLPQEFWDTAKQIQIVWNELAGMRNKLTENFERLNLTGADRKNDRTGYWIEFEKIWRRHIKNSADRLGADEREFLQSKFETADKRAKKDKTGLRKQSTLSRINFAHRFTGGGITLEKLKSLKREKFSMNFAGGRGVFGVMKDRNPVFLVKFQAKLHREIPDEAIIKSVAFVGKRLKYKGINKKHLPENERDWIWSINITTGDSGARKNRF